MVQVMAELAAHTHVYSKGNVSGTNIAAGNALNANLGTSVSTAENTPSGGAHNNVQPTLILNYIIKT